MELRGHVYIPSQECKKKKKKKKKKINCPGKRMRIVLPDLANILTYLGNEALDSETR